MSFDEEKIQIIMEKRNLAISLKCLSACNLQLPLSGMTYLQGKQVPSHSASQQLD